MKFKRSERLIDMQAYLMDRPGQSIPLSFFSQRYNAAKSSISEDLTIIKNTMKARDLGQIRTSTGSGGGCVYEMKLSDEGARAYVEDVIQALSEESRILPGGYIYLTDILGRPEILKKIGRIMATYISEKPDYILTVETKGIPLGQALAYELGVPMVIARKDSKVTEGPTLTVKYTSESEPRIVRTMGLSQDLVDPGSKLVLIDDFYRGGGTMEALTSLAEIFKAEVTDAFVLCENVSEEKKPGVRSLIRIRGDEGRIKLEEGSLFEYF